MAILDSERLSFEGLTLDPAARTLFNVNGECIPMRRSEFELLLAFVAKPGRALSRDYLREAVAGRHSEAFDRSIDVLVGRLRRKIEREPKQPRLIVTVPGIGYRFDGKPSPVPLRAQSTLSARVDANYPIIAPTAPRLSIVVMPFTNLSNDPDQEYFADGVTEDLTTDLSRIPLSFVISRNTAFMYKNKTVDTKQIGRELGVRYVVEGSVRRSGDYVRVGARLIDAATDAHLWAARVDGYTGDLFALQNEITSRIANALGVELIAAEAARPTEHPDALDYILRGRAVLLKPRTPETHREATKLYEHALALDPHSVEAQSRLAGVLVDSVTTGMTVASAPRDIARAEELVDRALAASPRYTHPHIVKGHLLRVRNRWEEAILEYEAALALDHNSVYASVSLARCKLYFGAIDEVIPLVEQAIRLSPRDPVIGPFYHLIGSVHLLQSHIDEAIVWLERARNASPGLPFLRSRLAAAYALRGETERARAELAEARRLSGGDLFSSIAHLKAHPARWLGVPKIRALFEATYFAGLRKAGVPED